MTATNAEPASQCGPVDWTVEQLHDVIAEWLRSVGEFSEPEFGEHTLAVRFDENGMPVAMEFDLANGADEESSMRVTLDTLPSTSVPTVSIVGTRYECGPTDGIIISVALRASTSMPLTAQLLVDGAAYGASATTTVEADTPTTITFRPSVPAEALGLIGQVQITETGADQVLLATSDVELRLPDGVGCG